MVKVVTIGDLCEEFSDNIEKISDVEKKIYVDDDYLVINIRYEYEIPLAELDTHEKILSWVLHLKDKTWVDWDVLNVFIFKACEHNGIKVPSAL